MWRKMKLTVWDRVCCVFMVDEAGLGPVRAKFPGPGGPSRDMRPDKTRQPQPLASFLAPETVHQTLQSLGKLMYLHTINYLP